MIKLRAFLNDIGVVLVILGVILSFGRGITGYAVAGTDASNVSGWILSTMGSVFIFAGIFDRLKRKNPNTI